MAWLGEGLKYEAGTVTKGVVDKIVSFDEDSSLYMSLKGFEIKATKLTQIMESEGLQGMLEFVMEGNDKIVGGTTYENFAGYGGNDILICGVIQLNHEVAERRMVAGVWILS